MKIPGIHRFLYKITFYREGKNIGTVKTVGLTKFEAVTDASKYVTKGWDSYDYEHLRPAEDSEKNGVVLTKNDIKREKC
jgi:hypothetical protein